MAYEAGGIYPAPDHLHREPVAYEAGVYTRIVSQWCQGKGYIPSGGACRAVHVGDHCRLPLRGMRTPCAGPLPDLFEGGGGGDVGEGAEKVTGSELPRHPDPKAAEVRLHHSPPEGVLWRGSP
eukprot:1181922-Prorocentrum_minimum.AAC.5